MVHSSRYSFELTAILLGCVHMMLQCPPNPDSTMSSKINCGTYIKIQLDYKPQYILNGISEGCTLTITISTLKEKNNYGTLYEIITNSMHQVHLEKQFAPVLFSLNLFPRKQQAHHFPSADAIYHPSN